MRVPAVMFAAGLLAGLHAPSSAQIVAGRVLEAGTDRPVVAVQVSVWSGDQSVLSTQTDSTGSFELRLPEPGSYRLRAERLGYAPAESDPLAAGRNEFVEVVIRLGVTAVPLPPITVVERRSIGAVPEFYRRAEAGRRSGLGRFITREQLDSTLVLSVTGVLARVPLVGMMYDGGGKGHPVMLSQGSCRPSLYLDGARFTLPYGASLDDVIDPAMLEGIEIYRNRTELPFEFAGPGECGAIVLWTRAGQRSRGGFWRMLVAGGALVGLLVLLLTN